MVETNDNMETRVSLGISSTNMRYLDLLEIIPESVEPFC